MNDVLPKLIVLRYALLPKQVLAFDDADGYADELLYSRFYDENSGVAIAGVERLLDFTVAFEGAPQSVSVESMVNALIQFIKTLPLIDIADFSDLGKYNPFNDFSEAEVYEYFYGSHIPARLEPEIDEASIWNISSHRDYYDWYNALQDKSLVNLLRLYGQQLRRLGRGAGSDLAS